MKNKVILLLTIFGFLIIVCGCSSDKEKEEKKNNSPKENVITSLNDFSSSKHLICDELNDKSIFATDVPLFANDNKIFALSYDKVFSNQSNCLEVFSADNNIVGSNEYNFYLSNGSKIDYNGSTNLTDSNSFSINDSSKEGFNKNNIYTGQGSYKLGDLKWYSVLIYYSSNKVLSVYKLGVKLADVDLSGISFEENVVKIFNNIIKTNSSYYYIVSKKTNSLECDKYEDIECEYSFKAVKDEILSNSYSDILNISSEYIIKTDKSLVSIYQLEKLGY